ncbi:MAG: hypothetical protein IKW54_06100, partial [Bacteroidales bacterium]|nr:hypothetical protein [Bacteroidales bacterium]
GKKADFLLKKRFLQGLAGTKNIGKYHKSGLFAEKQNGIGWRHVTDHARKSGGKHRKRTKGGNAASSARTVRTGQDGRQRLLRSQRRQDSQRKRTPY